MLNILHSLLFLFENEDFELVEELLELVPMKGKTGADEFFFNW
jgi:hypothetical protein